MLVALAKEHLTNTYHLFVSNIQRTYALPVGRTVWLLISAAFLTVLPSGASFGVAKVRSFFQFARSEANIFFDFLLLVSISVPFLLKRGAKVANSFIVCQDFFETFF
ncbi:hypothetical protein [Hymenobacter norwichensis]|uniref:hypothetical protein n=1 Tax=Hymenobacter norwichensis TaxID=223903 RepID=UPI00146EE39B|nr:hypothetical protein [Hymenobacter norwichensis]